MAHVYDNQPIYDSDGHAVDDWDESSMSSTTREHIEMEESMGGYVDEENHFVPDDFSATSCDLAEIVHGRVADVTSGTYEGDVAFIRHCTGHASAVVWLKNGKKQVTIRQNSLSVHKWLPDHLKWPEVLLEEVEQDMEVGSETIVNSGPQRLTWCRIVGYDGDNVDAVIESRGWSGTDEGEEQFRISKRELFVDYEWKAEQIIT